jgi:hypothetical protein
MEDYGFHQTKGSRGLGLGKQTRGGMHGFGRTGVSNTRFRTLGGNRTRPIHEEVERTWSLPNQ